MLGAVAGDIIGSRFEWNNHKDKSFTLFTGACRPTDDSRMTIAVARALTVRNRAGGEAGELAAKYMQQAGRHYPDAGYGKNFYRWIFSSRPRPYQSFGNGAAMRVSPCGWAGQSMEEVKQLAREVTAVTHDHPQSFKAAEAVSTAIFLARTGSTLREIEAYIRQNYYPEAFTLDSIRESYTFDVTCQGSVPQAFEALFGSTDFEDAVRNAVSIGGDSDTIAAITGSMAEPCYGIPDHIRKQTLLYLDDVSRYVVSDFEQLFGPETHSPASGV